LLQIRLRPVAGIEFAVSKLSSRKLRIAEVSFPNEHFLPVEGSHAKARQAAIDQFDARQSEAMRADVRKIAALEADVLTNDRSELRGRKLDALEYRTFHLEGIDRKAGLLQVLQAGLLDAD
jgi:hypothetical protein